LEKNRRSEFSSSLPWKGEGQGGVESRNYSRVPCLILSGGLLAAGEAPAASAKEINASVDVALERFYKEVKGAKFTKLDKSKEK
jgi:hypothetical protein